MKYYQVDLSQNDTHQTCWVNDNKPLRIGDFIRFKEEKDFWKVNKIYADVKLDKSQIHDDWQVGGIQGRMG